MGTAAADLHRRSRSISLNRPNTVNTTYTYDSVSRLLSVLHQLGTTTIDGASYGLDAAGNRVSKTNNLDGSNENYSYDAIYQLTQVLHNGTTSEGYTYDGVGNRLSSLGVPSYTVNNSNQLTSTSSATFTYDSNGNTTSKTDASGATNYTWDFENRLVSLALPGTGGTVTFKYDPFGRRIQKASPSGTINFAYDGANVVEELNTAGTATAQYAQGSGIDEPLATNRGGTLAFYEADGLGSVTSLTNGAGSALAAYTTDAFGKPVSTADSTVHNFFRYTGREYDSETGLYYYRARYYDPSTGRFIGEDPVGFSGDGTDFYGYVGNDAIGWNDPSGLCKRCEAIRRKIRAAAHSPRVQQAGAGLVNIAAGKLKVDAAGAFAVVSPETSGWSLLGTAYALVGGAGQIVAGADQLTGAITGDVERHERKANYAVAITSLYGSYTLAKTCDVDKAAAAAAKEGFVTANPEELAKGNAFQVVVKVVDWLLTADAATK